MALSPGSRLGVYEIGEQIGVGGMGEVYRATDTNLKRDVAIKVLPESVAADAERLARFRREAEVLASLNHPHIAQIYGLERSDRQNALVMELVEGPTLADLITQASGSGLQAADALVIARQIADALEAAHDRGIIHRDLKPANVKVRPDGTVKVLDFGLAKAMETTGAMSSSVSMSPTITTPAMTQAGLILGTAAYMSPEQAKGRVVDRRADIWAFGCVLFEMLSGKRAFAGEDVSDTLASVLKSDANWDDLPATVPDRVRQVIRLCLQKDARQRIDSIRDVRLALDGAFETTASGPAVPAIAPSLRFWQRPVFAVAGAVALLALGALAAIVLTRAPAEPRPVARFTIPLGAEQQFSFTGRHIVAMSPDGSTIAYTADNSLWLRPIHSLLATQVRGTEAEARNPFFSPDGQWIGYFAGSELRKVSVSGGAPVMICDDVVNPYGVSWSDDGVILFGQSDGIWKVAGDGGRAEKVIATEAGEQAHGPQLLPGGEWVLFTLRSSVSASWDGAQIVAQSLTTGAREVVLDPGRDARYLPTGHLVYGLGGVLLAVPFDLATRRVTSGPVPLVEGVRTSPTAGGGSTGAVQFAVADNGTLTYVPGAVNDMEQRTLVWVSADGKETETPVPARTYTSVSLSPDGTLAALDIDDETDDVWVADLSRGTLLRLTTDPGVDESPVWSTDGTRVIFSSMRSGRPELYSKAADGTGEDERVATFEEGINSVRPKGWSPDGRLLVQFAKGSGPDVGLVAVDGSSTLEPLLQTSAGENHPMISPDGRWIAYASNETGGVELYVQRFPALGDKRQLSVVGGNSSSPTWSEKDRALIYLVGGPPRDVMRVAVETTPGTGGAVRFAPPEKILDFVYYARPAGYRVYDVSRQDGRFLMIRGTQFSEFQEITVVLNWVEELKTRVPVK